MCEIRGSECSRVGRESRCWDDDDEEKDEVIGVVGDDWEMFWWVRRKMQMTSVEESDFSTEMHCGKIDVWNQ